MRKRIFLDDIEQAWVSLDIGTKLISSNDYNRDLYNRLSNALLAGSHAKNYWRGVGLL